jgi:hypothetical protein
VTVCFNDTQHKGLVRETLHKRLGCHTHYK